MGVARAGCASLFALVFFHRLLAPDRFFARHRVAVRRDKGRSLFAIFSRILGDLITLITRLRWSKKRSERSERGTWLLAAGGGALFNWGRAAKQATCFALRGRVNPPGR